MKKILIIIAILILPTVVYSAPILRYDRTIIPESNNLYDLGTSTSNWRNIFYNGNLVNSSISNGCASWVSGVLTSLGVACGSGGGGAGGDLGWASTTIPNSDSIFSTALSNVGIGTTSPFGKLSIDNRGSNTIPLVVRTNGSPANYTATNTAMIWYDSLGEELFRIFATDPDPTFAGYNTWNTYIGHKAGLNNTTNNTDSGYANTGVGYNTMQNITTGSYNASLGDSTLQLNTTGSDNMAIGSNSLSHNTTGSENVGLGQNTLQANISGSYNIAIGSQALNTSESGAKNVAIGYLAKGLIGPVSNSDGNTLIGHQSGYSEATGSNYNTAIGYNSAYSLTTGTYNIAIGQNIDLPSNTGSQQLNIGNLIYGTGIYNGSIVSSSPVDGKIGIGTTSPYAKLSVVGETVSAYFTATTSTSSFFPNASTTYLTVKPIELPLGSSGIWLDTTNKNFAEGGPIFNFLHGGQSIAYIKSTGGSENSNPYLSFGISLDTNAPTEAMRLDENGTLLLGTTTSVSNTRLIVNGVITSTSTPPSLSSCGTNPAVTGNNNYGEITTGATASGCTVTFATAFPTFASCVISNQSMSLVNVLTYTVSKTGFIVSETGLGGAKINYKCDGY